MFKLIRFALVLSVVTTSLFASPFRIVTTFYPLQIMAMNVASGVPNVTVQNLSPPSTGCLHDFFLTPQQMKSLADASVLIANGSGMETFLGNVLHRYPTLQVVSLSAGYKNPHIWLSVPLAKEMVSRLAAQLSLADPVHAKAYQLNANNYLQQLSQLDIRMKNELSPYRGGNIITLHEAFPYFAKEYGFNVVGVVEREPGSQPNAKEIIALRRLLTEKKVRAIFAEPQYPDNIATLIIRGTQTRLAKLDTAVTGPVEREAYLNIMKNNVHSIQKALEP